MGLSSALSNAVTGLGATARSAQVISSNIANAMTDGYGRRELQVSAGRFGGVRVDGVGRIVNAAVLHDRRQADASLGKLSTGTDALSRIADLLGPADSPASLSGRVARFEAELIEAASLPSAATRLTAAVDAAARLVAMVGRAAEGIQAERLRADAGIARDVAALNLGLERIDRLNDQIVRTAATGADPNGLKDQRAQVIDSISAIVPMRIIPRPNGSVALYSMAGQSLIDHRPAVIGFVASNAMAPAATVASGPLSGLTVDGVPVAMNAARGHMNGGTLAANFDIRDRVGPEAQVQMDAFARDLIERFEAGLDPTLAPGSPGLFTDAGAPFAPATELGLAQRLALNAAVDAGAGGAAWRLRDGLAAASEGPPGNAALLNALRDALVSNRVTASGSLGASARSAGQLADDLLSQAGGSLFRAEQEAAFASAGHDILREQELTGGVDSDAEMQRLLLVEQAYGANARVIQAVDEMLERLMRI